MPCGWCDLQSDAMTELSRFIGTRARTVSVDFNAAASRLEGVGKGIYRAPTVGPAIEFRCAGNVGGGYRCAGPALLQYRDAASLRSRGGSMHEQGDQDDDRDRNAEEIQKNRTHDRLQTEGVGQRDQASRWRPPKVADKLATNAPISNEMNNQSAANDEALRALSAACAAAASVSRIFVCRRA